MSTYYKPPRPAAPSSSVAASSAPQSDTLRTLDIADRSIYIFPTPSSLPGSPGGSSAISAPSDFTDFTGSDARSRNASLSTSASTSRSPVGRHGRSSLSSPSSGVYIRRRRSPTVAATSSDPEVEVWDWNVEEERSDNEYWELEEEVERASRWDIVSNYHGSNGRHRTQPLVTAPFATTNDFIDQHYRVFLRSRTQSNISSITSNSRSSSRIAFTPQPRIHIPLLSFFASLLFLDLDDPALRLLSQSSPDSVLFPGQSNLLGSVEETEDERPNASSEVEPGRLSPHGLLRLLADKSYRPITVLKDGFAIACDPAFPVPNALSLPTWTAIRGLGRFVGGVWSKGALAWKEVSSSPTAPAS
ncbi:hypothetical protein BDW22DRAFT_1353697 [Trametopsis cervina]|nr:hypothetical protein BDW22DRAFT_1353697 [Trametopsis cervina]